MSMIFNTSSLIYDSFTTCISFIAKKPRINRITAAAVDVQPVVLPSFSLRGPREQISFLFTKEQNLESHG